MFAVGTGTAAFPRVCQYRKPPRAPAAKGNTWVIFSMGLESIMSLMNALPLAVGLGAAVVFMKSDSNKIMSNGEFGEGAMPVSESTHAGVKHAAKVETFRPELSAAKKAAVDPAARMRGRKKRTFIPVVLPELNMPQTLPLYQSMTEAQLRKMMDDPAMAEAYVHEYEGEHTSKVLDNSFNTLKILHAHQITF